MRLTRRNGEMRWQWRTIIPTLVAALAGCGGGGGGGGISSSPVPVNIAIHWGARTRALNAPSSALSAKVTLLGAAPDGGDVSFTVDRDPNPAEYTATAKSGLVAQPGVYLMRAEFRALADGQGDVVG